MKLAELQRRMLADIMLPRTPGTAGYIKPNDRLTAGERLEIYHRQYWSRLVDSLRDDFPGLLKLLGPRSFQKLALAYLTEYPSRSFTLRDLGQSLPGWLARHPEYVGPALDMVQLEWAHIETWDAAASQPLGPEDLAAFTPDLPLALQPHLRLLKLSYPVDDVRLGTLSARAVKKRLPGTLYLATHRVDGDVFYRRLEEGEFLLLHRLAKGYPLLRALRGLHARPENLQRWFAAWAELGWLTGTSARSPGQRKTAPSSP